MARLSRARVVRRHDTPLRSSITTAGLVAWAAAPGLTLEQSLARATAAHAILKKSVENDQGELVVTSVKLRRLQDLDALPDGLTVAGGMSLSRVGIDRLPRALDVGRLDITAARRLAGGGEGLRVRGSAYFRRCAHLSALPTDARIDGDVFSFDCESLRLGPSAANLGGNIYMWRTPIPVHLRDMTRDFRGRVMWRPYRFPLPFTAEELHMGRGVLAAFEADSRNFGFIATAPSAASRAEKTPAAALPRRDDLPLRQLSLETAAQIDCPFLLERLCDLPDAVFWRVGEVVHGASYAELRRWWQQEQTDPSTRTPLTAEDLFCATYSLDPLT